MYFTHRHIVGGLALVAGAIAIYYCLPQPAPPIPPNAKLGGELGLLDKNTYFISVPSSDQCGGMCVSIDTTAKPANWVGLGVGAALGIGGLMYAFHKHVPIS